MKKIVCIVCIIACVSMLCFAMCGCGQKKQNSSTTTTENENYIKEADPSSPYSKGIHHVKVSVKGYDDFTITLDADQAPITVCNFCDLVQKGFYNGLTFHRIVSDFCLQGGDPQANGTGGSGQDIKGEFSANKVNNKLADNYKSGTVAMARSQSYNSASSQFFITLADSAATSLNGNYAAFGTIDDAGMIIVDKIVKDYVGKADKSSGTIANKADQPVINSITIID